MSQPKIKIGDVFNDLIVLEYLGLYVGENRTTKSKRNYYRCRCKCGNLVECSTSDLRGGRKSSCLDCVWSKRENQKEVIPQLNQLYNKLNLSCKKRGLQNSLSEEDFNNLVDKDCHYCGDPPRLISMFKNNKYINTEDVFVNGIDRLDSSEGYSKDNCVPCCWTCNYMKSNLPVNVFKEKIIKIFNHLNK